MKLCKNKYFRISALLLSAALMTLLFIAGCQSSDSDSSISRGSSSSTSSSTSSSVTVNYNSSSGAYYSTFWNLDTVITIMVYSEEDSLLLAGCQDLLDYYENLLSRTIETSEIALLNSRMISEISDDTAELLERGLYYSALTGGAYDVAIATISTLWDFTSGDTSVPDATVIAEALKWVDYTAVSLDGNTVTFANESTALDLGSIAKGYIGEKVRAYLEENGVTSAILNLGGNIILIGSKPNGNNFTIGIQLPFGDSSEYFCTLSASNISVVTSGVYERYFQASDGTYYHHILDPNTGYSYDTDIYSVTIIGPNSTECDGLSTSLFALGLDAGLELINSLDGYYAIFYMSDGSIYLSDGLTDAYTYKEVEHTVYSFSTAA